MEPKATGALCSGSITGGYVVRDSSLGALYGRYVYADYCTGAIRSLQMPSTPGGVVTGDCSLGLRLPFDRPTSFGEDAAGRLYISSLAGGVYRIAGPASSACQPETTQPQITTFPSPTPASEPMTPVTRLRIQQSRPSPRPEDLISISVSAKPCTGEGGRTVLLRRGGKPNGSKPTGEDCRARFIRRVRRRSTFRALLAPRPGEIQVKSRRLTVEP